MMDVRRPPFDPTLDPIWNREKSRGKQNPSLSLKKLGLQESPSVAENSGTQVGHPDEVRSNCHFSYQSLTKRCQPLPKRGASFPNRVCRLRSVRTGELRSTH